MKNFWLYYNRLTMKKIFFTFLWFFLSLQISFAVDDAWILYWNNTINQNDLRTGDIHTDDIPNIISWAINYLMAFAGTIALIFIIIGAYQMLFWPVFDNKSKGKETIIMALSWFALAALSWVIIKLILDNFS